MREIVRSWFVRRRDSTSDLWSVSETDGELFGGAAGGEEEEVENWLAFAGTVIGVGGRVVSG